MTSYDNDTTISGRQEFDFTDHTDHSLITDISRTLTNMSSAKRAKLRKQKLRKDLVREHFRDQQRANSRLKSIFLKLFN
jgi:hypothetical protein